MISTLRQPVLIPKKTRKRCVTVSARKTDYPKFAEAVNGRAAVYGMVFGSTNWAITGMNVIDQLYYPPTAAITILSSALTVYTMHDIWSKVPDETFERYAARDYGRVAMFVMTGMFLASLSLH